MSRYRTYSGLDDPPQPDADAGFIGVDMRRDPRQLQAGLASNALNKVFERGVAETRKGMHTVGWAHEFAVDFPLNFRDDNYTFYNLFGANITTILPLSFRVYNGTTFQLLCPETGLWHTIYVVMIAGAPVLAIDPAGMSDWVYAAEAPVGNRNYRLWMDRTFQLLCPATGLWHTLFIENVAGVNLLAIESVGVATAATYSPVGDGNWIVKGATTFCLARRDALRWHALTVRMIGGIPVLAIDQPGVDEDGFDFDQDVGLGEVFGTLVFSDPYGQEGLLVAVRYGVYRIAANQELGMVYLPSQEYLEAPVRMVQAFDRVLMFRGTDLEPLVWNPRQTFGEGLGTFETISQSAARNGDADNSYGDGTVQIPNTDDATLFNNRLYAPTGRDEIAVSDILDYTRYSQVTQRFKINQGSDDQIIRIMPFNQAMLLVFKDQSIHLLNNVYGTLSAITNDLLTSDFGLVGRDAVASVGRDVWFLTTHGVFAASQALDNKLQASSEPLSRSIQPLMDRINWGYADLAQMAYFQNRLYLAVPLDGETFNNAVLVFDFLNGAWSGYWTGEYLDVHSFVAVEYGGRHELFVVARDGTILILNHGYVDDRFGVEVDVADELLTRGYAMGTIEDKAQGRGILDLSTWNPSLTVEVLSDGVNEVYSRGGTLSKSRTKWMTWGRADYDESNAGDDATEPLRQDYSLELGASDYAVIGSGLQPDRHQRWQHGFRVGRRGQFAQLRVRSVSGRVNVHGVLTEAAASRRAEGLRA